MKKSRKLLRNTEAAVIDKNKQANKQKLVDINGPRGHDDGV